MDGRMDQWTDQPIDQPTDRLTDRPRYTYARMRLGQTEPHVRIGIRCCMIAWLDRRTYQLIMLSPARKASAFSSTEGPTDQIHPPQGNKQKEGKRTKRGGKRTNWVGKRTKWKGNEQNEEGNEQNEEGNEQREEENEQIEEENKQNEKETKKNEEKNEQNEAEKHINQMVNRWVLKKKSFPIHWSLTLETVELESRACSRCKCRAK